MAAYKPKYPPKSSGKKGIRRLLPKRPSLAGKKKFVGGGKPQASVLEARNEQQISRLSRSGLLLCVICLLVCAGGWFSYRLLVGSDIFRLTEVSVTGNRRINDQQIVELTGLVHGTNLLGFDVRAAERRALALSWVDQVEVKISWPARVVVRVQEHQPLAMVNVEENGEPQLYYIDRGGVVFAPVDPGEDIDFPVITGELSEIGSKNKHVALETLPAEALRFLRLAARGNAILPVQAVSEVHVDPALGLVVYLVDRPFPIYLGEDRIRTKYNRLVKILERLYRKKKIDEIKEIRMDYTENKVLVAMNTSGR